jgi:hypothetical protein
MFPVDSIKVCPSKNWLQSKPSIPHCSPCYSALLQRYMRPKLTSMSSIPHTHANPKKNPPIDANATAVSIARRGILWNVTCSFAHFLDRRSANIMAWRRLCYRRCWTGSCRSVWNPRGSEGDVRKAGRITRLGIYRFVILHP